MNARALLLLLAVLAVLAVAGAWWFLRGAGNGAPARPGGAIQQPEPGSADVQHLPQPGERPADDLTAAAPGAVQPEPLAAAGGTPTTVTGRVIDRTGRPIAGATASAFRSLDGQPFRGLVELGVSVTSAGDGRFEFIGLPADGPLGVEVAHAEHAPVLREPFTVDASLRHDLGDIVLEDGLTLEGTVSGPDGAPLEGATVTVSDLLRMQRGGLAAPVRTARTGADGAYAFPHLALRQYELAAALEGYGEVSIVLSLVLGTSSGSWRQDFRLELADSTLLGQLVDDRDQPVPGAGVRVSQRQRQQNTYFVRSAESDADGRFEFEDLASGLYEVELQSPRFYLDQKLELAADDVEHVVRVQPALSVAGRLRCPGGVPEAFVVRVRPDGRTGAGLLGGAPVDRSFTGTQPPGSFLFDGLRPGSYRFEVSAAGFAVTTSADVILGGGVLQAELVVDLLRGGRIKGRLDPPVAGTPIELRGNDYDPSLGLEVAFPTPPVYGLVTRTGADGGFLLEHVPPGDYSLSALPPDAPPIQVRDVAVADEATTDLGVLPVVQGGVLTGTVLGADGRPRAGVRVNATAARHQQQAVTDAEGAFRLAALPPGDYELLATPGNLWEALQFDARAQVTLHSGQELPVLLTLGERASAPR